MDQLIKLFFGFLLIVGCTAAPFPAPDNVEGPNHLDLEIESDEVEQLTNLEAIFTVTNVSEEEQTYRFSSGCQYGYTISQDEEILFDSRKNIFCTQALTAFSLEPGESKDFSISLANMEEPETMESGTYQLNAFLLDDQTPTVSQSFEIQ